MNMSRPSTIDPPRQYSVWEIKIKSEEEATLIIGSKIVKIVKPKRLLRLVNIKVRLLTGPSAERSWATIITTAGEVARAMVAAKADCRLGRPINWEST